LPHDEGHTVFLTDAERDRFLPISIGATEALAIHLRLEKKRLERPMTHDLLDELVKKLGGRVMKVQIDALEDDVFKGRVFLKTRDSVVSIDARASDSLAIALSHKVPIFVAERVVARAAIRPDDLAPPSDVQVAPAVLDL
jgi:bifunctional DNase/RNase